MHTWQYGNDTCNVTFVKRPENAVNEGAAYATA